VTIAYRCAAVVVLVLSVALISPAQLPTGTPVFGSFDSDGVNTINLATLNIHTQIPIFSRPGKGIPFSAVLNHDNVFWYPSGGTWKYTTNGSATGLDWLGLTPAVQGMPAGYTTYVGTCPNNSSTLVYTNWKYTDIFNTTHDATNGRPTPLILDSAGCLYPTSGTGTSADGYAISASVSSTQSSLGPNSPSTATQVVQSGQAQWSNLPSAVLAPDNSRALINLNDSNGRSSASLYVKGFNFNIPSNALIQGIKAEILCSYSESDYTLPVWDTTVELLKAGTPVGSNHANGAWPYTEGYKTYGNAADVWGTSWTPSDIMNAGFGIDIQVHGGAPGTNPSTGMLNYVRITVYYSTSNPPTATVTSPSGMAISNGAFTDPHGNAISVSGSSTLSYYDTLSTSLPVLTKSGSPASLLETYSYTGGSGTSVNFKVSYTKYTLQTAFNCPTVAEYSQANFPLATTISLPPLPNGTALNYSITYEVTPGYPSNSFVSTGRIASITLPTGGIIMFSYTGNNDGINCSDGSTIGLSKQSADGTWTYSRSGSQLTVTSPSPDSNVTVINFDSAGHELQRQINQGSAGLLETILTCYNSNTSNCATQGPGTTAISSIQTYTQIPDATGIQSEVSTSYNTIALPTEVDTYDWGASTPTTAVVMTYCTGLAANIQDRLCSKTTHAGTNNGTIVADQKFSYFSVGDLKSASDWVSGTNWLTKNYTYDAYGVLQTAQDVNNTPTTYGSFYCNNAFPGTITSIGVTWTTQVWDCNGGVTTSVKDANGHTVNYGHADPFWRGTSVGDTLSTTTTTYTSATQTESVLNMGTSSTQDVLTTLDVLGRVSWVQKKQSPTATLWDSVGYLYDSNGRQNKVTIPASCPSGGCTTLPATTTTTYDALGRVSSVKDPSNAQTNYTYTKNDVLIASLSPTIQKQLEYNALGQLKSVCEITSTGLGKGQCLQANQQTGYWTTYSYSPLYLSTVTQNAQGSTTQTRSFGPYDGLGRMASETNPETGYVQYFYDSDSYCGSTGGAGNLYKRVDNAGNITCFAYDGLHRLTAEGNGNVSGNTTRYFAYDTASLNGTAMTNAVGHMAEAYTAVAPNLTTKTTDEYFGYDIRGQMTDLYQLSSHSGGYFHTTASYNVNGTPAAVGGTGPMTALTYGLDGEGRVATISSASGQNGLSGTTYDEWGHVKEIDFGSGDKETFSFDPNTGRMTEYKSFVGTAVKQVYGDLTWNPNGTLQQLAITDQTNTANSQTCTYTYDDLGRSTGISCGAAWAQTFTYDVGLGTAAFGNLSKSGTPPGITFQPTYNNKNQYQSLPSFTPIYDADGNLLSDSFHTYTWDPTWNVLTKIDSTPIQYDALGRMVESSAANQIVYSPLGSKIDYMNGQSTNKGGFVNVPGGAQVLFSTTGVVSAYRHADWLGSKRLATGTGRGVTMDVAYAPYGETYANSVGTNYNFTGMDNDTKSDLFDFPAREYHPTQGRWTMPDPAGLAAVDLKNPQTWNRYAYVGNNPLASVDPLGLHCATGSFHEQRWDNNAQQGCGTGSGQDCMWSDCYSGLVGSGHLTTIFNAEGSSTLKIISNGGLTGSNIPWQYCPISDSNFEGINWSGCYGGFSFASKTGAANNGTPNPRVSCNSTTGICVPASMIPPPGYSPVKNAVKWYLCGKGSFDNIKNYTLEGFTKGVIVGGIAGWEGGPLGVGLGALGGGVEGFFGGNAIGWVATAGCQAAGMYPPAS
jgi:RHS repeat-associated protein